MKLHFKLIIIAILSGLISCSDNKTSSDTVGYWSFDNISGNSIIDESNFGNNAYTDVVKLYKGYCGNGLIFGQSKDEAITVPYSKSMNPNGMSPKTLTFEAYVKIPKLQKKSAILLSNVGSGLVIKIFSDGGIGVNGYGSGGSTIPLNKWTHIAIVLTRVKNDSSYIYINKELDKTIPRIRLPFSENPFKMAYFKYSTTNDYLVDEIRLTYDALDPAEFLTCE